MAHDGRRGIEGSRSGADARADAPAEQGLESAVLRRRWDLRELEFETTAELEDVTEIVGQPRAAAAIHFGIGVGRDGYNIFALGVPGTGKRSLVLEALRKQAAGRPIPPDLCYVHNFEQPQKPRLLCLPAGTGSSFRHDMEELVQRLRVAIADALQSESYQARRQAIDEDFKARPQKAFQELRDRAEKAGLVVDETAGGLVVVATHDGQRLTDEAFARVPEQERARIQARVQAFEQELEGIIRQLPKWVAERHDRLDTLRREVTGRAVDQAMEDVRRTYASLPEIVRHLDAVRKDVIGQAEEFLAAESPWAETVLEVLRRPRGDTPATRRYEVNVLVDHKDAAGAPAVYEENPTYDNLIGRIEHRAELGALITDFSLIRAGAMHRANGGYLVLEAHRLLQSPYAWEALKRTLQSGRLRMESLGQALSLVSTVSLQPEPLTLDLQVVLLGDPVLYYLLSALDPDFGELFKVAADFDDRMDATPENVRLYARLVATLGRKEGLRPFRRDAVGRLFEESARWAGHREKLSTRIALLQDLLREADYHAGQDDAVAARHVEEAIQAQIDRAGRLRDRIYEEIGRGTLLIDTEGARSGQVNGLSVLSLGAFAFGRPTRITARVRMGRGDVVDIEREVELGGPIHSKGVLILAGYLGARYTPQRPLALSASLVFEQSYGGVEGDSASAAELFALLSAIGDVPLRQSLAVTGSVSQHGEIQAVDGINEKVEGFFDVCRARGLTGEQGVIVPAANVPHLMLRQDVVDAVRAGRFHLYVIGTVDEGLERLTGLCAGERDAAGRFPEGSVNARIEARLAQLADAWQAFNVPTLPNDDG